MTCRTEIVCIGSELLTGHTLNTNAHWLAREITRLGGIVTRISVVGDDLEQICDAVRGSLRRKSDLVITSGGLGPTHDDKTLQGIAKALDLRLMVHPEALVQVRDHYRRLGRHLKLTKARVKMATLPEGGAPIRNPIGTAPAVLVRKKGVVIIALPGIPMELKSIFRESIAPLIRTAFGEAHYYARSLTVKGVAESRLAPLIDRVMKAHPSVYVKSHPKGLETGHGRIELNFSSRATTLREARMSVAAAIKAMRKILGARR